MLPILSTQPDVVQMRRYTEQNSASAGQVLDMRTPTHTVNLHKDKMVQEEDEEKKANWKDDYQVQGEARRFKNRENVAEERSNG